MKTSGIDCFCAPWMHMSTGIGNAILDAIQHDSDVVIGLETVDPKLKQDQKAYYKSS